MTTYAILARNTLPGLEATIEAAYPDFFRWTDRAFFITTNDTPREIAVKAGVKYRVAAGEPPKEGHEGVVIIAVRPTYYGWTSTDLWEWLRAAFQKEA